MEPSADINLDTDIWSLNDQDSNAIILPEKKKKKTEKEQVSKKIKTKNNIKLSQSQENKAEETRGKCIQECSLFFYFVSTTYSCHLVFGL